MTQDSKIKSRNAVTFIFLLAIFVILAVFILVNLYSTSMIGTRYSDEKTKNILECSNFKNPVTNLIYYPKTKNLSFIFENYETNMTINKIIFISDLNQTKEVEITNQFGKYSVQINATKKINYRFDICDTEYLTIIQI